MEPAENNRHYFSRRADEERAAAAQAADARAAQSHRDLAARFDSLAKGGLEQARPDHPVQFAGTMAGRLRIIP